MSSLRKGGRCPQCEKGRLEVIIDNLVFTYKNQSKTFENEKVYRCGVCDYAGLPERDNRRIDKELTDFRREVEGLLTGKQMRRIRETLGLNKKQMAGLLSVNEKTVGRYENGKITQSVQVDKLYKLIGLVPSMRRLIDSDVAGQQVRKTETTLYNPHLGHRRYRFRWASEKTLFEGARHAKAA